MILNSDRNGKVRRRVQYFIPLFNRSLDRLTTTQLHLRCDLSSFKEISSVVCHLNSEDPPVQMEAHKAYLLEATQQLPVVLCLSLSDWNTSTGYKMASGNHRGIGLLDVFTRALSQFMLNSSAAPRCACIQRTWFIRVYDEKSCPFGLKSRVR